MSPGLLVWAYWSCWGAWILMATWQLGGCLAWHRKMIMLLVLPFLSLSVSAAAKRRFNGATGAKRRCEINQQARQQQRKAEFQKAYAGLLSLETETKCAVLFLSIQRI